MAQPAPRGVAPVRIALDAPLLLEPTLKGGQAFRWRATAPGRADDFVGLAESRAWRLRVVNGHVEVTCDPPASRREAAAWTRRYLRLDDDYAALGMRLRQHRELVPAMDAWWGLRLLRTDPWECLLGFLTSIHDSVGAIETRIGRLCRHFGPAMRVDATVVPGLARGWAWAMPGPERLARAHEARLRSAAGMGFRARYVRGAARMVARGEVAWTELPRMGYPEAHEVLLQLPGVGDKVADCVQLYSLGHLEAFPVDRWIQRVMERDVFHGQRTRPRDIVAHAQARWGRDAGYAQQFLFHHARVGALAAARRAAGNGPTSDILPAPP